MTKLKIGIVGAGLAGLGCALELRKCGHDVHIFEEEEQAGGRVRSDEQDGFILDHGFQIYLSGYEKGQYFLDYKKLGLKAFSPGALVWKEGVFHLFSDPLRRPKHFLSTLMSPVANLRDKLLMLKLRSVASDEEHFTSSNMSTIDFLKSFGFSYKVIESFFRPFFSGVFLTYDLQVDHHYFLYLFNKFGTSLATLPEKGMQAIPDYMVAELGKEHISLGAQVESVSEKEIVLKTGECHSFDHVVIAMGEHEYKKMIGDDSETPYFGVTTHYYKTRSKAFAKKYLFLNSREGRIVNHVACLSRAQKSYAPKGEYLFSVNCLELMENKESEQVRNDLSKLFGPHEIEKWEWIKAYPIKYALNQQTAFGALGQQKEGPFMCGDYLESPSIQGALSSGFKVAHHINQLSS